MTDRELLESTAKAAGLKAKWIGPFMQLDDGEYWYPLEDNGDAFDLMIKLGLRFEYFAVDPFEESGKPVCVISWAPGGERNRVIKSLTETGDEASAVVRRAIVMAAAKIGSKKP